MPSSHFALDSIVHNVFRTLSGNRMQTTAATRKRAMAGAPASLAPWQRHSLRLVEGAELRCTHGAVCLTPASQWLDQAWAPSPQHLPAGQAWRASMDGWVTVEAGAQAAQWMVTPPP